MLSIQKKYINRICYSLQRFEWEGSYKCTFRCPICGDSKKKQTRKRGNLFVPPQSTDFVYKCYNCHCALSFMQFLEQIAPHELQEYRMETFASRTSSRRDYSSKQTQSYQSFFAESKKIAATPLDLLPETHKAVQYVMSRHIPRNQWSRLSYTENFTELVAKYDAEAAEKLTVIEDRLIIPFYNKDKELIAFQGRSFNPKSELRYLTVKVTEEDKSFGEELLDRSKTVFAVEGPIDSLFIPNCIAKADGDIGKLKADIYIIDNQPRNREVMHTLEELIEQGKRVVIFPDYIKEKDINAMIMEGMSRMDLIRVMANNVYQGIAARLRFAEKYKLNE